MIHLKSDKVFTVEDRQAIEKKVRAAVNGFKAVVLVAVDNVTYAAGITLPYAEQYPEPRAAIVIPESPEQPLVYICPADWAELGEQQDFQGRTVSYTVHEGLYPLGLASAIARVLVELGTRKGDIVGTDSQVTPVTWIEHLRTACPGTKWQSIDTSVRSLRMLKTPAEVRLLEEAARQADRAIVSALNHSEGCVHDSLGYSMWEFTERIRVHVGEFGGSATGLVAAMQGADTCVYIQYPHGNIQTGNPIRAEVTNHHYGYWADNARTLFVGQPSPAFLTTYRENISLKHAAVDLLRPGKTCCEVFLAITEMAKNTGIALWAEPGIGHGVGTSEREAPYLSTEDNTPLVSGMVIALTIYTYGPEGELICSKDTYEITDSVPRLMSWYRDWDSAIYRLTGNTARHG